MQLSKHKVLINKLFESLMVHFSCKNSDKDYYFFPNINFSNINFPLVSYLREYILLLH